VANQSVDPNKKTLQIMAMVIIIITRFEIIVEKDASAIANH